MATYMVDRYDRFYWQFRKWVAADEICNRHKYSTYALFKSKRRAFACLDKIPEGKGEMSVRLKHGSKGNNELFWISDGRNFK